MCKEKSACSGKSGSVWTEKEFDACGQHSFQVAVKVRVKTIGFLTSGPASPLHGWASEDACEPPETIYNVSYVLCVYSWKKGPELLRNIYDLLQNEDPLT